MPPLCSSCATQPDPNSLVIVAVDGYLPGDFSPAELVLNRSQFAALTPGNSMKMTHIQREPGRFDCRTADALAAFAPTNQLKFCGHCLVSPKGERITFWDPDDGRSWLDHFPWERVNSPFFLNGTPGPSRLTMRSCIVPDFTACICMAFGPAR